MLYESWPWKRELQACAQRLRDVAEASVSPDWPPGLETDDYDPQVEAIYAIERDIMVGCLALRRLLTMPHKVTQEIRKKTILVTTYPIREGQQPPDVLDALDAYEFYNLGQPTDQKILLQQVCNLFIHSYVLHFAWDPVGVSPQESLMMSEDDPRINRPLQLTGFFVATDTTRRTHLTRVDLVSLANSFDEMGRDNVVGINIRRDHRGRRKIITVSGEPYED